MVYLKSVAKGFLLMFLGLVFTKVIALFYKVVFSRYYGAHGLGVFSIGFGIFTLLTTFSILGFNYGLSRYISLYQEKNKEKLRNIILIFFSVSFVLSIIFAIGLVFLSNYLAVIYKIDELAVILRYFAAAIPLYVIILMLQKIFEGFKDFKYSAILEGSINFLKFVFLVICVFYSFKLPFVVLSFVLTIFLVDIFGALLVRKYIKLKEIINSKVDKDLLLDVIRFSWPLSLVFILHTVLNQFDSLILGYFSSPVDVGVYNLATSIAGLISLASLVGGPVLLPSFGDLYSKKDDTNMKSLYISSIKWLTLLSFPILFITVSYPGFVLKFIGGSEFSAGAVTLMIISIAFLINTVFIATTMLLMAIGKTKYLLMNTSTALIFNLILNVILIKRYGIIGAAITFLITAVIINSLRIVEVKKLLGLNPFDFNYIKSFLVLVFVSVVSFYLSKYLFLNEYYVMFSSFLIFLVLSFVLLLVLKCFTEEDNEIYVAIKKKILRFKN